MKYIKYNNYYHQVELDNYETFTFHTKRYLYLKTFLYYTHRRVVIFQDTHQKIENTKPQHFEGDAHVSVVVEPVKHLDAQAVKDREKTKCSLVNNTNKKISTDKLYWNRYEK